MGIEGWEMYGIDINLAVRRVVTHEGFSHRQVALRFDKGPRIIKKKMIFSIPPGYRRNKSVVRGYSKPLKG